MLRCPHLVGAMYAMRAGTIQTPAAQERHFLGLPRKSRLTMRHAHISGGLLELEIYVCPGPGTKFPTCGHPCQHTRFLLTSPEAKGRPQHKAIGRGQHKHNTTCGPTVKIAPASCQEARLEEQRRLDCFALALAIPGLSPRSRSPPKKPRRWGRSTLARMRPCACATLAFSPSVAPPQCHASKRLTNAEFSATHANSLAELRGRCMAEVEARL